MCLELSSVPLSLSAVLQQLFFHAILHHPNRIAKEETRDNGYLLSTLPFRSPVLAALGVVFPEVLAFENLQPVRCCCGCLSSKHLWVSSDIFCSIPGKGTGRADRGSLITRPFIVNNLAVESIFSVSTHLDVWQLCCL